MNSYVQLTDRQSNSGRIVRDGSGINLHKLYPFCFRRAFQSSFPVAKRRVDQVVLLAEFLLRKAGEVISLNLSGPELPVSFSSWCIMVIRHNEKSSSFVADNLPTVTGGFNPVKYKELTVEHGLLPLTSLLVEPAKVLFLNNAINHGIFTPLGMDQVKEFGQSIFFMIEANPGPGLGLLMAYYFFTKGDAKDNSVSAMIIEFFGGIHEIYFPYVLMNPITLIGLILGGMTGVMVNVFFGSGLVSSASPGSIIAILGMCAKGSYLGVILSIAAATAVSFIVNGFLLKTFGKQGNLDQAKDQIAAEKKSAKGIKSSAAAILPKYKIAFCCDAGMGSSAMGAEILIPHYAINEVPLDTDIIVTHESLVDRAKSRVPSARIYPISNFLGSKEYDAIVNDLLYPANNDKEETNQSAADSTTSQKISLDKIAFCCDAGMGSSAMGAASLSKKLKAAGINISVPHYALNEVPQDTQVIITHESLVQRAKDRAPMAHIYPIQNFLGSSEYDDIVKDLKTRI